uniref:RNase H type-1 domain-containing protein n=1 Tax=Peronospora matthiolae TaxID=2874970 RepID=A0AAV1UB12_9STRA
MDTLRRTHCTSSYRSSCSFAAASSTTPPVVDTDDDFWIPNPWLLQFDGACRRNPGQGGAGAALFDSSGTVVWTCSNFLTASTETNNTAEYTALLVEWKAQSAMLPRDCSMKATATWCWHKCAARPAATTDGPGVFEVTCERS